MPQYVVREATLHQRPDGSSIWRVTFAPSAGAEGDEIALEISPARLERMSFAAPYSEADIDELTDRSQG
jgi:hypothetical protein